MSNINNWLQYELYPNLFEVIDIALPEHNFKKYSGGWKSKTYLNGSPHKNREDKTVITKKAISCILEQGGDVLNIVNYVIQRDKVEFIEAVKTLADVANLKLPANTDFNQDNYKNYKDTANILEDCNSYFIYCLENNNPDEIKTYLTSRGYSKDDIKSMELGYIPSQNQLYKYLTETKNHPKILVDEIIKLNKGIGDTHQLTIPYRSGSTIKGFKFRTIGTATPKYLNSTGLDRLGGFFNLLAVKGNKDIIIVEGELDSLSATSKGIENVVATGGSNIASEQVKDAIKRGAKSFTLCFDKEISKKQETSKRINSAIDILLKEGINKIYIVDLPALEGEKTDPDRLIKENGITSFKNSIIEASPYYEYKLNEIFSKYSAIEEERALTPKDVDNLLEDVVNTSLIINDPIDRDRYKKLFTSTEPIKEIGITAESLTITIDKLTSTRDKENQDKELKKLLSQAKILQDKGDTNKALELIDKKVKEVKLQDKTTEFSNLLNSITEDEIRNNLASKPESLNSGYEIGGEKLLLPSGAISILCAPTSHGKTTFLINIAINVAKNYQNKEVHFFSYEEDSDSILINALNTYLDEEISFNNRKTLKSYFTTGSTEYIKSEAINYFKEKKEAFFKNLIATKRLNIHYSNYNSETLIESIRYLHKNTNIGAVFIDYIQLLNLPSGKHKTYSRQEEIKAICVALKDVAVETGLPIILGAQFNRNVTNCLHLHPTKIGEAGDIERIANLIVAFWNNNHKSTGSEGELNEISKNNLDKKDTFYTEILKQRGGKVGLTELLEYNGNKATIKNSTEIFDTF
ncbi:DnaB-like helicase C-terminal domain-containing protein [Tenacibaculum finnmarkense]|uniref:DnaB-like helicase C-terminal domain-containing protein n=3 Tax=Tenacibaculum finnmarkense TaxID=2781243 RepID=UPI001EFBA4FC|nr:DnaB-like helicase C-terminal domain-containing protein [Tenacibaculum finnmarkense]MCG8208288.1 toprim domain-containing protein [Tenacibaculum finnmarkense genomovar finnmarkense]MCG8724254.1 toprim domain-containing protein [Tenacibaculum finnmarkense]MCG8742582.1 toprim domain-containing protein [Tenacibaculum finnmarkense]MCG8765976.1 toprim domain-containing protein [Tenacibaculum finnmarkense]MCG8778915.1 toprim domain-containing protein [Tenacibaculum finnmarkense]